ncbi:hypothetical protein HZB03_03425 [Candidatus Woesearchaeota archaeon]|nr:hypothetical protein [Candidatus Woesearchaeota archaeon]
MIEKKLETLVIEQSLTTAHSAVGDFCAEVSGSKPYVPKDIVDFLCERNIHTAEEFISLAYSFPSSFVDALGWRIDDVTSAGEKLAITLRGHVDDAILNPGPAPKRAYCALPPPDKIRFS